MKKLMLWIAALAAIPAGALQAQTISGTWQGALKVGPNELRTVVKISLENDKLKAVFYSIDQGGQPLPVTEITQDGASINMKLAPLNGTYDGKLSADGNTITGNFSQGGPPLALNLTKATPESAWTIPDPLPPPKIMPADAKPSFEVATIKPARVEERFSLLVNRSGMMNTTGSSISDLLKFAYDLHPRQIAGGPAWLESEKFDVSAKPDTEGIPNGKQLKEMVQKLLADRFQLTFHRDKKELSVYAISIAKGGHKLTKDENNPNGLPGFGGGRGTFLVRNATMEEFAHVLQANVLERPVVDQSGLGSARWDFTIKWTPDASQLAGGLPGAPPPPADGADAPPDIFLAFQQQLGLKLDSTKAPVEVLVVDKIEKPSAN